MNRRVFSALALACSVLLLVGVLSFAGPCVHDDGTVSMCFGASRGIMSAGIVAAVFSAVALALRNPKAAGACSLVAACAGLFAAFAPGNLLALCMMQTMRCWTVMQPFALVCGLAAALFAAVAAVLAFRDGAKG